MTTKTPSKSASAKPKSRTALVLQGGGALGAYQAGVYQALHEHDLAPDWVVGTSIGAINAALIAGNEGVNRVDRLRQFWDRVSRPDAVDMKQIIDPARRANTWLATVDAVTSGVTGFFKPRPFNMFAAGLAVPPDDASFYDTQDLADTLRELIDFKYLHAPGGTRLSVNAVKVTSGELVSFDSQQQPIEVEHIMASGALPPGFPGVRIAGELYWDGGLYSNTPLESILNDGPSGNTLCFMVDLWNPVGTEPTTMDEVQTRQKDIMFASRSTRHIDAYLRTHKLQRMIHELYESLPPAAKGKAGKQMLQDIGCNSTIHIVRIPYSGQDWHMAAKDINFSKGSIEWRWEQGYRDALRAVSEGAWLAEIEGDVGVVVHDLPPEAPVKKTAKSL